MQGFNVVLYCVSFKWVLPKFVYIHWNSNSGPPPIIVNHCWFTYTSFWLSYYFLSPYWIQLSIFRCKGRVVTHHIEVHFYGEHNTANSFWKLSFVLKILMIEKKKFWREFKMSQPENMSILLSLYEIHSLHHYINNYDLPKIIIECNLLLFDEF